MILTISSGSEKWLNHTNILVVVGIQTEAEVGSRDVVSHWAVLLSFTLLHQHMAVWLQKTWVG